MLEALVSSRIRRALLEHVLACPGDRFYLRGLAKQLGLSVSPLRRELKRLVQAGMLRTYPEGNLLFYTVDTASAAYQELRRVGAEGAQAGEAPRPMPVGVVSAGSIHQAARRGLSPFALAGVAVAGLMIMAGVVTAGYLLMTNRQLASSVHRALSAAPSAAVAPALSQSGAMRSSRWQVVPGSFGGFTAGSAESY